MSKCVFYDNAKLGVQNLITNIQRPCASGCMKWYFESCLLLDDRRGPITPPPLPPRFPEGGVVSCTGTFTVTLLPPPGFANRESENAALKARNEVLEDLLRERIIEDDFWRKDFRDRSFSLEHWVVKVKDALMKGYFRDGKEARNDL